jgi:hypothetical protein
LETLCMQELNHRSFGDDPWHWVHNDIGHQNDIQSELESQLPLRCFEWSNCIRRGQTFQFKSRHWYLR